MLVTYSTLNCNMYVIIICIDCHVVLMIYYIYVIVIYDVMILNASIICYNISTSVVSFVFLLHAQVLGAIIRRICRKDFSLLAFLHHPLAI